MNHLEFQPYHNRHIRFKLNTGAEFSGVLLDPMNSHESGKPDTVYAFIPTNHMIDWKKAEEKSDKNAMKDLERDIDITDIVWAERINY